jgi:limonene-1,2-epoxide hydrolase
LRLPLALGLVAAALLAACGGGPPSPESVVRAWSNRLNEGDNDGAAKLFAPGAEIVQSGRTLTLDTTAEARAFNAGLPCSGEIVALESRRDTVTATFVLGDRDASRCDGPGAEVRTVFRVRDGKIVLWHQLPSTQAPAGGGVV